MIHTQVMSIEEIRRRWPERSVCMSEGEPFVPNDIEQQLMAEVDARAEEERAGDCSCTFDARPEGDSEDWLYWRTCAFCGHQWMALHCPHERMQHDCPSCRRRPVPVQSKEGANG